MRPFQKQEERIKTLGTENGGMIVRIARPTDRPLDSGLAGFWFLTPCYLLTMVDSASHRCRVAS